ncbi:MAG: hypothetical protein V7K69_29905 [Nostoc sp.]|uniref:hypothetical protein n=1 Tax=Nostoc sp. TaxID=1180 RepID=UPI002FF6CFCE
MVVLEKTNAFWSEASHSRNELQRITIKRATTKSNTGLCFRIYFCGGFDGKLL